MPDSLLLIGILGLRSLTMSKQYKLIYVYTLNLLRLYIIKGYLH